jgi:acetyl esterase/lipase
LFEKLSYEFLNNKGNKNKVVIFVHGGGWRRGDKGKNPIWGHSYVGKHFAKEVGIK